jgi:phosphate transport system protein
MTHLEEELKHLKREVSIMFALVHQQLKKSHQSLVEYDNDLAHEVILTENRVNAQELKIDRDCENLLALHNPVAIDLRYVLAVLKINNNLERTGDIADGIARFLLDIDKPFDAELIETTQVSRMFELCIRMMEDIEDAFAEENTSLARSIFKQDKLVDEINQKAGPALADYIARHPGQVEPALNILSSIRKLERVGDQAKNIAEEIIFYVEAKVLKHSKK